MIQFRLPDIGEGVVEAELLRWRVAEGETVAENQTVAELLTDKAAIEVPSPRAGRIQRLLFKEGDVVAVGDVLFEIDESAVSGAPRTPAAPPGDGPREPAAKREPPAKHEPTAKAKRASGGGRGKAATAEGRGGRAEDEAAAPDRGRRSASSGAPEDAGAAAGDEEPERGATKTSRRREAKRAAGPRTETEPVTEPGRRPSPPQLERERQGGEKAATSAERRRVPPAPPRPGGERTIEPAAAPATDRVLAVPAIRSLAERLGVDLEQVEGTGPRGRVLRRDIERFLREGRSDSGARSAGQSSPAPSDAALADEPSAAADAADWTRVPLRGIRRKTAERMRLSKSSAAHFTYVDEVDMTECEAIRRTLSASGGELSPLAFIARAVLDVLPAYPMLNASLDERRQEIILKRKIHLGIATATEHGLLVPVIRDATSFELRELAAAIARLAELARGRKLTAEQLAGGTFTITSLGKLGGLMATPIIHHPETAILAVHAIRKLPRYVGDELAPRLVLNLSVSLDHRLIDGIDGARFIQDVKSVLESGDRFRQSKE